MNLLAGFEGKKTKISVNGHEIDAVVSIRYEHETEIDFSYWEPETAKQTQDDIRLNKTQCVYLQVSCMAEGLEGLDSLGQTFVRSSDFTKDLVQTVEIYDMVKNAKQDLTKQILDSATKFQKYLDKVK